MKTYINKYNEVVDTNHLCITCDGTGKVHSHNPQCLDCHGNGHHTESRELVK